VSAQSLPSSSQSLQIYFTASGKGDSPAILNKSELSVALDKQPAQITSLRRANPDKMLFALLVDLSGSEKNQTASIREAALQLFQGLLEGGNEGYLVMFNRQVLASKGPVLLPYVRQTLENSKPQDGTVLYDAIGATCSRILSKSGNPETPRRAIFVITDGEDNASEINGTKAEEMAEREGVAIFSLQTEDASMSSSERDRGFRFLREASLRTGGRVFKVKKAEQGVPLLLNAIQKQWVLDVERILPTDGNLHALAIKSSEKSVQISQPALIPLR
jgi:Mg-chelatase subunit ChlD